MRPEKLTGDAGIGSTRQEGPCLAGTEHDAALLGTFLRSRRARLDPVACGFPAGRRRTQGLRREEVAVRAGVSATWYTWLEQGRDVHASAEALERIVAALQLGRAEREHLFLLAQRRPPPQIAAVPPAVSPRLQRMVDAMPVSPAQIRNRNWDILAWNRAAIAVMTDYAALPPGRRNVLRLVFTDPRLRGHMLDWERDARALLAGFRAEQARGGATPEAAALVDDLCRESPEFARWWGDHEVQDCGEGTKRILHPIQGTLSLDFTSFAVDGEDGLSLVVYTPASAEDRARVEALLAG